MKDFTRHVETKLQPILRSSITEKKKNLLRNMNKFYENQNHFWQLHQILSNKNPVSLRTIDYFCSSYSSKGIVFKNKLGNLVDVFSEYQDGLGSLGKANFDPFRRDTKIKFIKHGKVIETTVGQLRFFAFIIDNGILDYIVRYKDVISQQMASGLKMSRKKRKAQEDINPQTRKRKRIPNKYKRKSHVYKIKVTIKFSSPCKSSTMIKHAINMQVLNYGLSLLIGKYMNI